MAVRSVSSGCLEQAQVVLEQSKKQVVSSSDMLDVTKMGPLKVPEGLETNYKKFGVHFLSYLQYDIRRVLEQAAINVAARSLQAIGKMELQESPILAQVQFGRGECVCVSILAATRLLQFNPIVVSLTAAKSLEELAAHTAPEHNFVLLGVEHKKFQELCRVVRTVTRLFDGLQKSGGVILDVFLSVACPIAEYQTKAKPLLKYTKAFGTHFISEERSYSPRVKDAFDKGFKEAEEIHKLAAQLINQPIKNKCLQELYNFLATKVESDILDPMVGVLKRIFPNTAWKSKFDMAKVEWMIWSRGDAREITWIADELRGLGLKIEANQVKDSGKHAIILRDPFPSKHLDFLGVGVLNLFLPRKLGDLIMAYDGRMDEK